MVKEPRKQTQSNQPVQPEPALNQADNMQITDDQTQAFIGDEAVLIINELTADIQKLQAEFANYKRRSEAERLMAVNIGKQQAAISLLPVLDNIERAIAHEPEDIKNHAWVKGISSVASQLESQLEGFGLVKIGVIGEAFDPTIHEAVTMEESDGETEVVADVLQTGYKFGDTVIRPAMVKVTKK